MRYQWISRLLGNARIEVEAVMAPYAREVLARACTGSRALVVIIDQSKVNERHHMVMVSLRVGERALPLAWRVKKTQGAIGFREQRAALATVAALLPEGVRPTLMGDRFYGSPALIAWCRDKAGAGGCAASRTCACSTMAARRPWPSVSRAANTGWRTSS